MLMLFIETEPNAPAGRFAEWIPDATIIRPFAGDPLPDRIKEPLIVFGTELDRGGDEAMPWLPQVRALLAQAVADSILTLAIGLGAHQLALATGGTIKAPKTERTVFGNVLVVRTPDGETDPLVSQMPADWSSVGAGWAELEAKPKGAVQVVRPQSKSKASRPQIFRAGTSAWGVTFHPEATIPDFLTWGTVFAPDASESSVSLRTTVINAFYPTLAKYGQQLAEAFAALTDNGPRLTSPAPEANTEVESAAEITAALDTLAAELLAPDAALDRMRALAVIEFLCDPEWPRVTCTTTGDATVAQWDNGGGDSFAVVGTGAETLLRAFDHESAMSPAEVGAVWPGLLDGLPAALAPWSESPEFDDEPGEPFITLALWSTDGTWQHGTPRLHDGQAPTVTDWMLGPIRSASTPRDLADDLNRYYDLDLTARHLTPILGGRPLTEQIARKINPDADWDEVRAAAEKAGYPIA
ncbi:hypothetical protein JCM18882A_17210 [Brevibacterium metallidurans]|uniref:Uncharacterized protein n=3 Tax=Brevibacteriaceae TaxID=85019 RepID=K9AN49_9MICO|nr:hypothetical protein C272_04325 [Brevibacterium casei S18]